ncbi:MAG: class I SAM-dependent methyltransferase [Thermodesulfobacteriota bacterium]|nr:class I SAM-dependent methyltransferase [Thermodesulfobacteriota bacterium]
MYAVDVSQAMLECAQSKATQAGLSNEAFSKK